MSNPAANKMDKVRRRQKCKSTKIKKSHHDKISDFDVGNTISPREIPTPNEQCGLKIDFKFNANGVKLNQWVMEKLKLDYSLIKLNALYIEINCDKFFCKLCHVFVDFDETAQVLLYHLRHDHNNLLKNYASDFILEVGIKNIQNKEGETSSKFKKVLFDIALNKKFISHVNYIGHRQNDFFCYLCNINITFSACGKYVESHFFTDCHLRKTYEINCIQRLMKKQPEMVLKKNSENKKPTVNTNATFNADPIEQYLNYDNPIKEKCNDEITVTERRLKKSLLLAKEEHEGVKINSQFITIQENFFLCELCQEYTDNIIKHCCSPTHNNIMLRNVADYIIFNCAQDCFNSCDEVLHRFNELLDNLFETDNVFVALPHIALLDIRKSAEGASWPFCLLCKVMIRFSRDAVEAHFLSKLHKENMYKLNCDKATVSALNPVESCDQPSLLNSKILNGESLSECKCRYTVQSRKASSKRIKKLLIWCSERDPINCGELESYKQFIEDRNNHVFCTICKVFIGKFIQENTNLTSVLSHYINNPKHINSKLHKSSISSNNSLSLISSEPKEYFKKGSLTNLNMLNDNSLSIIKINKSFISLKDHKFFCKICLECINFEEDVIFLKSHCLSVQHSDFTLENAQKYASRIKDNCTPPKNNKQFKKLKDRFPSEIIFIGKKEEDLCCLLCRIKVPSTSGLNGFFSHFESDLHRMKTFALNCKTGF